VNKQELIRRTRVAAEAQGREFREVDLADHVGIIVGQTRSTIGSSLEVADGTAAAFFRHFEDELGKKWWR